MHKSKKKLIFWQIEIDDCILFRTSEWNLFQVNNFVQNWMQIKPNIYLNLLAVVCQIFSWLNIIARGLDVRDTQPQRIQRHHPMMR